MPQMLGDKMFSRFVRPCWSQLGVRMSLRFTRANVCLSASLCVRSAGLSPGVSRTEHGVVVMAI